MGAGRIGHLHARNIAVCGRARIGSVYDTHAAAAEVLAHRHGAVAVDDADAVFDDPRIDAVFICSPTDTHVSFIERAARSGKAIFCEKPIDLDYARVMSVVSLLEQFPVTFMTGFHRRFDASTRRIREHVDAGRIGDVEFMRVMARDPGPPPAAYVARSGGLFRDMMIHDLDLCRWLTGREFTRVFARGFNLFDPGTEAEGDYDTATATLWDDRGFSVVLQNSRRSNGGFDQRIEVMGSAASVSMDNVPVTQTRLILPDGLKSDALPDHFPERYAGAYVAQLSEFLSAIEEKRQPITTAIDGIAALQLADACALSATEQSIVNIMPVARSRAAT
ncbi:Gfo/Idh/MocA family protein [Ensifer soli]|uniref:Gfo/Idh/MocA family protein n=1 Tax=Ciceribacter sp. sgz301302 TaxID=3342379 RepID=UPI0035BA0329